MEAVSVPCGACGQPVRGGDDFCEACGAKVSRELKAALRERMAASHAGFAEHQKRLDSARTTIGVLSILFFFGGVVMFFVARYQADDALVQLGSAADSAPLAQEVAGASTVGELRSALSREPWQVLGLNLFLSVVMVVLWLWARRSVLPAIISALGIYVAVIVASGVFDPGSIPRGIFMKIVVLVALARGISSALDARKLEIAH